jgi:hypothetical protein
MCFGLGLMILNHSYYRSDPERLTLRELVPGLSAVAIGGLLCYVAFNILLRR